MAGPNFGWDSAKDAANQLKHGVSFAEAQFAFTDARRVIAQDLSHGTPAEARYYCFGEWAGGVLTVRFTYRKDVVRIFGAGYWRRGKEIYEQANQLHRRAPRSPKGNG